MTTSYPILYLAHQLTLTGSVDSTNALSHSIANALTNLKSHQIDAALFALRSPFSTGAILTGEVGLGTRCNAKSAVSLREKLDVQRAIKALDAERNRKRRSLYEAQDEIELRRDGLIADIEVRLQREHSIEKLYTIRWCLK